MRAKDLINLLFKVEESKEIQESIFYTQFGMIGQYFREKYRIEFREQLTAQLHDKYVQAQTMDYLNENDSEVFIDLIKVLALENNLDINEIIN